MSKVSELLAQTTTPDVQDYNWASAHDQGYNDGYEEGYASGYDDGYNEAEAESCEGRDVWVILFKDAWAPDGSGAEANFYGVVGSEFAAQEKIDELNSFKGNCGQYYFQQASIDAV